MTDKNNSPGQEVRLQELLSRGDVRDCLGRIHRARGHLRELSSIGHEHGHADNVRLDVEEEADKLLGQVQESIDVLDEAIRRNEIGPPEDRTLRAGAEDGGWSLGTVELRTPLIPILRGSIEPVRRVVIAPRLPAGVVLFFLSIDGLRELLVREVHGHWGYHYHYLDAKERRSDTLLTFEQHLRTLRPGQQVRVLTWERHAEKSKFKARAWDWADKKRESVYRACLTDSAKRALTDYKVPAKDAEIVWPPI